MGFAFAAVASARGVVDYFVAAYARAASRGDVRDDVDRFASGSGLALGDHGRGCAGRGSRFGRSDADGF